MAAGIADTPPLTMEIVLNERVCPRTGCRAEPWEQTDIELRPGPSGWRIWYWGSNNAIKGFTSRERVTSRCRGDPRSPLCLVEGIFSCVIRGEYEHCRRAEFTHGDGLCFRKPGRWLSYEITELGFPGFTNLLPYKEGVIIRGTPEECRRGMDCSDELFPFAYGFVPKGKTWSRVYVDTWTEVERCWSVD